MTALTATGKPYKTVWSDAAMVRLAEFRSWWDETAGDVQRSHGPVPDGEDPWAADGPPDAPQGTA